MLRAIVEEIWTNGVNPQLVRRIGARGGAEGWDAAYERAKEFTARFEIKGFEHTETCSFTWGRDPGATFHHRFVVI